MLRKGKYIYNYFNFLLILVILIILLFGSDSMAVNIYAVKPKLLINNNLDTKTSEDSNIINRNSLDFSQVIIKIDNTKYEIKNPVVNYNEDKNAIYLFQNYEVFMSPDHEYTLNESKTNTTLINKLAIHSQGVNQNRKKKSVVLKSRKLENKLLKRGLFIKRSTHILKRPIALSGKR